MRLSLKTLMSLSIILIFSCMRNNQGQVVHFGALKNFMHKGDISAKADLKKLESISNLYAIGAVEKLKGEILILNGRPFTTTVQNGKLINDNTFNHKASLLVYAPVTAWSSYIIPDSVMTLNQLELFIEKVSLKEGRSVNNPFPFLIEGKISSANWHVIDWDETDTVHTHEKHKNSGLSGIIQDKMVTLLGFYSRHHKTIFTHHSTYMHIHILTEDEQISGHLDDAVLSAGMILKLMK